ncbi:cell division protein FtsA [Patescibacteria group bacterium]|nr:cell division protein FtsA [Patescibacteria group bacterium]MBU1727832.1 cell division protein FtsA [Patescibacteria group bacterium]
MIKNISIGIDIGSSTTRVVVGEFLKGEKNPKIIGIGESETRGIRHGYVVNFVDAVNSIKNAVSMAEKISGVKIKRAYVSINSITLRGDTSSGLAIISRTNNEITNLDVNKALEDSENNLSLSNNRKIIQMFPISYRLDGKEVLGKPEGMCGTKLEVKSLFVTCSSQHLEDLVSVMAEAGIETIDIIASSVAGSNIALTRKQKMVGSALVNIGSETVSLAVFENGSLISLHSFPIGSTDITNDIALGFKIPLEKAESFKLGHITEDYSKKKLNEIIEARLSDIFDLVENHLKKIKRNELLPAGIVFIGGGANIPSLEELSKSILKLPSKIGTSDLFTNTKTKLRDPSWFTALGLITSSKNNEGHSINSLTSITRDLKNALKSIMKQLLP